MTSMNRELETDLLPLEQTRRLDMNGSSSLPCRSALDCCCHLHKGLCGVLCMQDYNYPPGLNILHYNAQDIEDVSSRRAVHIAHAGYIAIVLSLVLNFAGSVGVTAATQQRGVHIGISIINLIVIPLLGLWGFHSGYKGLAIRNANFVTQYLVVNAVLCVFSLISMLVSAAFFHGLSGLASGSDARSATGAGGTFWVAWTYIESISWLCTLLLNCVAFALVLKHRTHGRPVGSRSTVRSFISGSGSNSSKGSTQPQQSQQQQHHHHQSSGPSNPLRSI